MLFMIFLSLILECSNGSSSSQQNIQIDELLPLIQENEDALNQKYIDTNQYIQKRSLTAASAGYSSVSGLSSTILSGVPFIITVTAKDSSGNLITTGGEVFTIKISNLCTKYNSYYCDPNGASGPLSSDINGVMTDHSNGTYTYTATLTAIGSVSVQVYLLASSGVYQEFYDNRDLSGPIYATCIKSGLSFNNSNPTNCCISDVDYKSAKIITSIKSPYTGSVTFYTSYNDGMSVDIDNVSKLSDFMGANTNTYSFTVNLVQNQFYKFYGTWRHTVLTYDFSVKWSYGSQGQQLIPNSNLYLITLVGSSPYTINVVASVCGDGKRTGSEACDDNDTSGGDGCSTTCTIETGWSCSGGSSTSRDTCNEICGDSKRFNSLSTYCDDGNTSNSDGCNSSCQIEAGWNCSGGSSTTKDTCTEICGDSRRFNIISTYCDDGNNSSNDGCSSTCSIETGWICSGGTTSTKDSCTEICGDGIRFNSLSTYCDDGNTSNSDGCNSSCQVETGWTCSGGTTSTKDTCTEICGDGIRFNSLSTYCDDGNTANGDGCSLSCSIETGWQCTGGSTTSPDSCYDICGDALNVTPIANYCDDGNLLNNDGCNSFCRVEIGWNCSGGTKTSKDKCKEICGDGIRFNSLSSYCDDKNTINGDGCYSSCGVETGWACKGGSFSSRDFCSEICGDGIRFNTLATYCDDGNLVDKDGCSSLCKVESGYICNGGNSTAIDMCSKDISPLEEATMKVLLIILIIVAVISAGNSLLSKSSPIGIFSMINQFQLLFLLPVSGTYLSSGVLSLIIGLDFCLLNFNFIKLENVPVINNLVYSRISIEQSNDLLVEIGIVSGSTLINILKLMLMILIIFFIHVLFIPIYCKCRSLGRNNICKRFGEKFIDILTYSIYIRLILESFIIILFSIFGEIYQLKIKSKTEIFSFCINILIAFILFLFFILCVWQIKKAHPVLKQSKQTYFTEFFSGLKDNTYSRLYPAIFMGQRILSCFLVIILSSFNLTLKIVILTIIQASCLVYLLLVRPYEKAKDSFTECMSQFVMSLFCCILIRFNTESDWNSIINWILISTLLISSLISCLISFIEMIIKIVIYTKKSCCNKNRIDNYRTNQNIIIPQITQNANEVSKITEEQK